MVMSEELGTRGSASLARVLNASDRAVPMTKHNLVALANAFHRTLASSLALGLATGRPIQDRALVVAFFQRSGYFFPYRLRYEAYGALGVTTLVGFPGDPGEISNSVEHVDLSARTELEDAWVIGVFDGPLAAALVAVDDQLLVDGPTLEDSRQFSVRWTIDSAEAREMLRQVLNLVRPRISRRMLARVESVLTLHEPASPADESAWLSTLLRELVPALEIAPPLAGRDEVAERDLLTGLHNRLFLERYLPEESESSARLAAVLLDVDNLASLNERRGPTAGDAALVGVAAALASERRPGDVLARIGADEFLLLAPVADVDEAIELAGRLVVAARATRLDYPFEDEEVTVSVGVCIADPADLPMDGLTEAVAKAKADGKNRVELADRAQDRRHS
jgi:diguanylate cyclase (GGDEF)-like protein